MTEKLDPIALRRTLHTMPELAFQEVRTSQFVADTLEKLGYEVTRNVGNTTGVIGVVKGAEPGPTLMLRADMDALPFEIDGKPCAIHACGHDAHSHAFGCRERIKGRGKARYVEGPLPAC